MLRGLLYLVNIAVLVALVLACLCCYVQPSVAWPLSFLGLGFPVIVLTLGALLIVSGIARRRIFWVNLIALLVSAPIIRTVVSFHKPSAPHGVKIMSYNVKNFDLYNWSGNKETRHKIMRLIDREAPDVICFQEYYTDDVEFSNTNYLRDSLGYPYHYVLTTYEKSYPEKETNIQRHLQWGIAIFSRHQIIDTGVVAFSHLGNNQCIYADLLIKGKPLRVYNTHLQSIHLGYDDYDTIEELSENQSTNWYRVRNILRKIKRAFVKRAHQADVLHARLSQHGGPKILCGDFNDAPVSYAYHTISAGMQDAFIEKGLGFGKSFTNRFGIFRIDYILVDPKIKINSYQSIREELSDHYPVMATVDL